MFQASLINNTEAGTLLMIVYIIGAIIVALLCMKAFYWNVPGLITHLILSLSAIVIVDALLYWYFIDPPRWTKIIHVVTYDWMLKVPDLLETEEMRTYPAVFALIVFVINRVYHLVTRTIIVSRKLFVLDQGELGDWNRPTKVKPGTDEADIKITNACLDTNIKVHRVGLKSCVRIKLSLIHI